MYKRQQLLTAVLAVWYLFHLRCASLDRESFLLSPRLMRRFLPLGVCSFLSQLSLVAAMAAINNMIRKYGAQDPVFGQEQYCLLYTSRCV